MTPPAAAPAFLDTAGWPGAHILPLAGDASFRRYFRIVDGAREAVLMDAPPPHEDPRPFIAVGEWLCCHGFAAPEILARN
ncbi:MAG: phosphotransferase, partial [Sphingomonadales bacterium]|nr:phosphotransferase [Sphingomonadales bacterium]